MTDPVTVSRREWRWVLLFGLAVMALTMLPYMVAWLSAGDDWEFGGFLFGVDDGYSYLAKMRLGATGAWLFVDRYTSEPHSDALLFLPYILLGKLAALVTAPRSSAFPTTLAVVFHATRVVCGLLLLGVSYRFVAAFLHGVRSRRLALVLIALGGGLGWLLALTGHSELRGSLPVDFIVPEGYSFLILFGLPHLALARAALLGGFLLLFKALRDPAPGPRWRGWAALAGLCWVVTGLNVPFFLAVVYLVLGGWGLVAWVRDRRFPAALFWRALAAVLVTIPLLAYTAAVFLTNDVFAAWSAQNQLRSPHPVHYVLGYLVLALPAAVAVTWAWRRGRREASFPYLLLVAWVAVALVAVYLPINVQRRLAEGVIVPLSILAVVGVRLWFRHSRPYARAAALVVALVVPTTLLIWLGALASALTPGRPAFHPTAELAAIDALNEAVPRGSVVLSLMETGNYLPVRTDLIPFIGHGPETVDSGAKKLLAQAFFAGDLAPDAVQALLARVDYVYFGPLEEAASPTHDPAWAAQLVPVPGISETNVVRVYEVPHD